MGGNKVEILKVEIKSADKLKLYNKNNIVIIIILLHYYVSKKKYYIIIKLI